MEQYSILDSLISVVIILFILSVIVEKITQLIRRYAPFIKPGSKIRKTRLGSYASSYWRNINKKQKGVFPEVDKRVEREVNSLSFVIGLAIALLFRVDLFKMFQEPDPRNVLFWSDTIHYSDYELIAFVFSVCLTGFFLSFGSKFFHDLLDTLFQVKNLKRKSLGNNSIGFEDAEDIEDYLGQTNNDIVEAAISENQSRLYAVGMIGGPLHGKMLRNGKWVDCIDIHVASRDRGSIPESVPVALGDRSVQVPVHVVFDVDVPRAQCQQGDAVAAVASPNFKGTIACRIRRNQMKEDLLVTCSHVMTNGSGKNFFGNLSNQVTALAGNEAASFVWALCDDQLDTALLKTELHEFQYRISPQKERALKPSDIMRPIRVVRQNGIIEEGVVVNHCASGAIPIAYSDGETGMHQLILLSKIKTEDGITTRASLTMEGDSGALVYDLQDRPVGIIIAGNSKFSYAISITTVLKKLGATIKT
jgi:hypothetical protein